MKGVVRVRTFASARHPLACLASLELASHSRRYWAYLRLRVVRCRSNTLLHPLVLLQELLLDGTTLESMHVGDDTKVAQDFNGSELPPCKQLVKVEAAEVSVVNECARG